MVGLPGMTCTMCGCGTLQPVCCFQHTPPCPLLTLLCSALEQLMDESCARLSAAHTDDWGVQA